MPWSQTVTHAPAASYTDKLTRQNTLYEHDERAGKDAMYGTAGDLSSGTYLAYPYNFPSGGLGGETATPDESPYRPALALDPQTIDPDFNHHGFSMPLESPHPSQHVGYPSDAVSLPDPEQIITPSMRSDVMYGFCTTPQPGSQPEGHTASFPSSGFPSPFEPAQSWLPGGTPATQGSGMSHNGSYFAPTYPYFPPGSGGPVAQQPAPNTISPAQLNQTPLPPLKAARSFSEMLREPRASTSSASSTTDGGQDVLLDDWARPMQRALQIDLNLETSVSSLESSTGSSVQAQLRRPSGMLLPHTSSGQWASSTLEDDGSTETLMRQYVQAPNRLAFGERKLIIMTPRVGQKSYGTEKRFLCPHPQATLVGNTWWRPGQGDGSNVLPPSVNISLTGEDPVRDSMASWIGVDDTSLDEKLNTTGVTASDRPFYGSVAGKNLHISDKDGSRKEVRAVVTVKAPRSEQHPRPHSWSAGTNAKTQVKWEGGERSEVVCEFPSKEIKVISKPSKKKSSMKPMDRKANERKSASLGLNLR